MRRSAVALFAALAASGCGGEEERAAAPTATPTPEATSTPTAEPPPKRARSDRACAELWNAEVLPLSNSQVTASDFVAELARETRTPVHVDYQAPHCFVVAPIGRRRIAIFSAARGRRPYSVPERTKLKPDERVPYNGRARRDGTVELRD